MRKLSEEEALKRANMIHHQIQATRQLIADSQSLHDVLYNTTMFIGWVTGLALSGYISFGDQKTYIDTISKFANARSLLFDECKSISGN